MRDNRDAFQTTTADAGLGRLWLVNLISTEDTLLGHGVRFSATSERVVNVCIGPLNSW